MPVLLKIVKQDKKCCLFLGVFIKRFYCIEWVILLYNELQAIRLPDAANLFEILKQYKKGCLLAGDYT